MPRKQESSNPENQNFLIRQIASGLTTTTELIQSLSAEIRDNSVELATIKADLTNVTKDVRGLSRILKEGNGTAPVLSRIAVLELSSKNIEDAQDSMGKGLSEVKKSLTSIDQKVVLLSTTTKLETEDKKSRRQVIIAAITGILALISAIAVAFLT